MLLKFQSDLQAFVVSDATIKSAVHQGIGYFHSPGEDLIEMTTQYMGDSSGFESTSEVKVMQFTVYVGDVIVEITTYHNCSFRVLLDDIFDDIGHSLCSVHFELFLSRFEVAIQ
jgi:hypothetical protein